MRTFVALELDDAVRARLAAARDRLAAAGADVRLVDPALYHLTVKFLGEIDEADAEGAGAILEAACAAGRPSTSAWPGWASSPRRSGPGWWRRGSPRSPAPWPPSPRPWTAPSWSSVSRPTAGRSRRT